MLKRLEIVGFKSFARKTLLDFSSAATAIVGPNGSGKSNVAEAFRFALGEQSMKSMRGKRSEDLIWSGSHTTQRSNRASVAIVFDNRKRIFPKLDFEEVSVERAVFRDGSSEYLINGTKVRLRDIQELLASANIGETGHHIISQGEADRILLAHPRERRAMLEDALGLKVFEFKKQEAQRKLEKTQDNVREVEALRREIAPHIRFLQKQVEKIERAEELMRELATLARTYLSVEEAYIATERAAANERRGAANERLTTASAELAAFDERATTDSEGMKRAEAIRQAEREVDRITSERSALGREIGRVEGGLHEAKKRSASVAREPYVKVTREDLSTLREVVEEQSKIVEGETVEPGAVRAALLALRAAVGAFFERYAAPNDDFLAEEEHTVFKLENERVELMKKDEELEGAVERARSSLMKAREAALAHEETGREEKRRILGLAESKAREEGSVVREDGRLRELQMLADELERDRAEVLALAGVAAFSYEPLELAPEERRAQEDRKRQLERLKIRVEEAGGTGEDVRKEYTDATEREAFLMRELEDLSKSAEGLAELIRDLDDELTKTFAEGLAKVNHSFGEYFAIMFGGGGAKLVLEEFDAVEEDEESDEYEEETAGKKKQGKPGIEISVNLPKKRVQSLMQLSGGERALTSIALIFAMSQVNPPPFLILDETDAALDEANSRRYGDMIEELAKRSQLIVISHNRETMSRAGILYGVTMGADGVSKLLSVKFEEAAAVAK
ncbi:MAG: Smc, chromosome segregation ATPase, chromosome segregation protein [Parcubacteria group bacterium]|nr:Smc, chromosome segregation ATPase, chromosome segregation protein [Parcubacteria group bacterium]